MADNTDFNFEAFSVAAIKAIDEIRSFGKDGAKVPTESRINAFYRAIGLPAAVAKKPAFPGRNNGNTFDYDTLNYDDYKQSLDRRRHSFNIPITEDEVSDFLLFNESVFTDSVLDATDSSARMRGVLKPMLVDGELPIYPQEKRVATAFKTNEELKVGTNTYSRPLIESIILMRLKTEGLQDQAVQQKINADFGSKVLQDLSAFADVIKSSIIDTTNTLSAVLESAVSDAADAKIQTGENFEPAVANIAQQSLPVSERKPKSQGQLDALKAEQQNLLSIRKSILTVLEYDDTADDTSLKSRNAKNTLLSTNMLSLIGAGLEINGDNEDPGKLQNDIKNTEQQIEKATADVRGLYRTMDLLFGTFGGISGVDIILVLAALFDIKLPALIGLLNTEAQTNLVALKGKKKIEDIVSGVLSVKDAIKELETSTTKLFINVETNAIITKHKDKPTNQGA